MASTATNRAANDLCSRYVSGATFQMLLLTGTTTNWNVAATGRAMNVAADITADETSDGSYSRQAVNITCSEDDTNNRGELHFADVTFTSLAATTGQILGVAVIRVVNNDSDSPIVGLFDVSSANVTPTGADLIVRDGAEGAIHLLTTTT